ncbi:MAG TPA: serine hydroxymethyltransferase, partial [Bacteroidales bacterium]|nr:serine hydroxymethyltransferase [Bacteroidales bacterium]
GKQVLKNANAMANAFLSLGYHITSGGTDNHLMLIDLRSKFPEISGKKVENTLVHADITINKNMVPFDTRSPFLTSGIRIGAPAITTRGLQEAQAVKIVEFIDEVISNIDNPQAIEAVRMKVHKLMADYPLYAF